MIKVWFARDYKKRHAVSHYGVADRIELQIKNQRLSSFQKFNAN